MTPPPEERQVAALEQLTPKERACLRLVLENWSSKEIGRHLGIAHTSVDTHIRRARAKLGLRDRYAAARLLEAWERGERAAPAVPDAPAESEASSPAQASSSDSLAVFRGLALPLESLGPWARLMLVVLIAAALALLFGAVFNALRAL